MYDLHNFQLSFLAIIQGIDTGHISHTMPFLGGGGPGGWGGAVYILPMNFYRIYGDFSLLEKGYPTILRWLEYMALRCEEGLIVREETGGWCLGEWCAPSWAGDMIPAEFINTYYYIQGLEACGTAAEILHIAETAFRLLTCNGPASFARMMQAEAHTSHNHPMFGSVVKLLFTEILGIRQREDNYGFADYFIEPADITTLRWAEGSIRTVAGNIYVRWNRDSDGNLKLLS